MDVVIKRFIATPIGVAKYSDSKRRYNIFFYNKLMPLHRALFLSSLSAKERKKMRKEKLEVHHIDGNKFNNELSNLCALTKEEHKWVHSMLPINDYTISIIENKQNDAKKELKRCKI